MKLAVGPMVVVGETHGGVRGMGVVTGGSFEGPRLSSQVLNGGNDWQMVRKDASATAALTASSIASSRFYGPDRRHRHRAGAAREEEAS
ncbi:MAG: DUF3237 family protein [Caulobacteraceae bacterium]